VGKQIYAKIFSNSNKFSIHFSFFYWDKLLPFAKKTDCFDEPILKTK
jgi:hypothetical protein